MPIYLMEEIPLELLRLVVEQIHSIEILPCRIPLPGSDAPRLRLFSVSYEDPPGWPYAVSEDALNLRGEWEMCFGWG
jgi:hypothetical protein